MTTGERLQTVLDRKFKGKKQYEVAEKLGVPPGTLSEWLSDEYEPTLESLRKIAAKCHVTVASLIGDERPAKAGDAS